jgi:hypothetical protein
MSEQPPPDMSAEDIVYKEYVRLSEASIQLVNSSFEDFKLLAVVGVLLGFKPVTDSFGGTLKAPTLFVVFLTLLSLLAIIGFRDILKRALVDYTGRHLVRYETAIRRRVAGAEAAGLFKVYGEVEGWTKNEQLRFVLAFNLAFLIPVLAVPAAILWRAEGGGPGYSLGYAAACLLVFAARMLAGRKLPRKGEPGVPHGRR